MKFLVFAFALVACVYAEQGYDYPQPAPVAPQRSYIPPPAPQPVYSAPAPAPVHHEAQLSQPIQAPAPAPVNTYIPPPAPVHHEAQLSQPIQAPVQVQAPVNTYIPPSAPQQQVHEQIEQHADDGYRYRTVRRRVFRHRA